MTEDDPKDTPMSGVGKPIARGVLRLIPTPNVAGEPITVDAAPDGMGGVDVASLLTPELDSYNTDVPATTETPIAENGDAQPVDMAISEPSAESKIEADNVAVAPPGYATTELPAVPEHDDVHELDDFDELTYADGSTTPPKPQKRGRRRKTRDEEADGRQQLQAVIAEAQTDVWAAHRDPQWHTEEPPAMPAGTPTTATSLSSARPRRRPSRLAVGVGAVVLLAGAGIAAITASGGGPAAKTAHHHSLTHPVPQPNSQTTTTPAAATTTSPHVTTVQISTQALLQAERKAKAKDVAKRRTAAHRAITTNTTPATTTVALTTPPVQSTPARTPTTGSSPPSGTTTNSSTVTTTNTSSQAGGASGGLPNAQQVSKFPGG